MLAGGVPGWVLGRGVVAGTLNLRGDGVQGTGARWGGLRGLGSFVFAGSGGGFGADAYDEGRREVERLGRGAARSGGI